jgi:hypothetical protein
MVRSYCCNHCKSAGPVTPVCRRSLQAEGVPNKGWVKVIKLDSCTGEASVSNRKGKRIVAYELNVTLTWYACSMFFIYVCMSVCIYVCMHVLCVCVCVCP